MKLLFNQFNFPALSLLFLLFSFNAGAQIINFDISFPERILGERTVEGQIIITDHKGNASSSFNGEAGFIINNKNYTLLFNDGVADAEVQISKNENLEIYPAGMPELLQRQQVKVYPLWLSILPPLIAIILALILKEVLISLFAGIFTGLIIIYGFTPAGLLKALLRFTDTYLLNVLTDADRMSVIIFSFFIGGMVGIITKNGGMTGVVSILSNYAKSARRSQLITWLTGMLIFFDDYANTLIVGNTMRPVTDKYKISREKLAYIVDSTAAPIVSVAFITTWIGAELGYIRDALQILDLDENAYSVFFNSLKYSYYPVLALAFVFMLIIMKRDFGLMYKYEKKARSGNYVFNDENNNEASEEIMSEKNGRFYWINAVIPVFVLIAAAFAAMIYTGYDNDVWADVTTGFMVKLSITIGDADAYKALLWASFASLGVAFLLTLLSRTLNLEQTINSVISGIKGMLAAMFILVFAWILADLTKELHTAEFISNLFMGNISPYFLPAVVFILSGLVAFSTGSSWGTMAILYPLMLPVSFYISIEAGLSTAQTMEIFYHTTSVILAGAVFGDHCSPISDTTILSSLASKCNHITHVKTQMPYALTVAAVSILIGHLLFVFLNIHWLIEFILCGSVLFIIIYYFGKKV